MTTSEENYMKVIYHLSLVTPNGVNTNAIAGMLNTKPSSVTEMLKKLSDKEMLVYQKYQGVTLSENGLITAKMIVRKHRLWEVFLLEKLDFSWDEVHDIAEQLEHIKSEKLIDNLDAFLGFPKEDPHGDPIPDKNGNIQKSDKKLLSEGELGKKYICVGVKNTSSEFLQYLDKQKISLGTKLKIIDKESFDNTFEVEIKNKSIVFSNKIANNLYIK